MVRVLDPGSLGIIILRELARGIPSGIIGLSLFYKGCKNEISQNNLDGTCPSGGGLSWNGLPAKEKFFP
jgi:hypothetical protein